MKKLILFCFLCGFLASPARAQYEVGTVGLLHLPTADMEPEGTFRLGGGWLNKEATPTRWAYDTFNYFVGVTLFDCLDITYDLTMFKGKHIAHNKDLPEEWFKKWSNQDRNFSLRLRVLKEGQFFDWMPQVVVGGNDVLHTIKSSDASDLGGVWNGEGGNGSFGRIYLAMTKHFAFQNWGNLGVHVAYMNNDKLKRDYGYKGVGAGADFRLQLPGNEKNIFLQLANGLDLKAEYDTRKVNIGFTEYLFKDRMEVTTELFACKYPSVGVTYKVKLKP